MSKEPPARILFLLASAEFSDQEIVRFEKWLFTQGPGVLRRELLAKRRFLRSMGSEPPAEARPAPAEHSARSASIAGQLQRLLQREAGMTTAEAAKHLLPRLTPRLGGDSDIVRSLEPRPKESLERWATRLLRVLPASALLSEATRVRNEIVHHRSDWPLREDEP